MNEENQNNDDFLYNIYLDVDKEISKRELSNAENRDKSILQLSSAGLGLSIIFVKDIVDLKNIQYLNLLTFSWISFVVAIAATLLSYLFAQSASRKQRELNYRYYIENEDVENEKSFSSKAIDFLSYVSIFSYFTAVLLTALFIIKNHKF